MAADGVSSGSGWLELGLVLLLSPFELWHGPRANGTHRRLLSEGRSSVRVWGMLRGLGSQSKQQSPPLIPEPLTDLYPVPAPSSL